MALSPFVAQFGPNNKQMWGTAYPTASTDGTFEVGDVIWNTAPAAGGGSYQGWVCVVRGAPGTWKHLAAIET
jgi:hypothetical protein